MEAVSGKINIEELKRWGKNTLTFLAPAIVIFLLALQSGVPIKQALIAIYLWVLNVAIDYFKKLSEGK